MLDIKILLDNTDGAADRLKSREPDFDITRFENLQNRRRELIAGVEEKKSEQNKASREIGARKQAGESADDILAKMKTLSQEVKELGVLRNEIEETLKNEIIVLPNIPLEETPVSPDKSGNVVVNEQTMSKSETGFPHHFRCGHIEGRIGLPNRKGKPPFPHHFRCGHIEGRLPNHNSENIEPFPHHFRCGHIEG